MRESLLPIFGSQHLLVRPLRYLDAEQIFNYRSAPQVSRYQTWVPKSIHDVVSFIKNNDRVESLSPGTWYQLAVVLKESDRVIGDLGIHMAPGDKRQVEFGITIAPEFQRRGFAAETIAALLKMLFIELAKHRVFASIDPRNVASQRLLESLGMRKEAHMVKSLWFKGEWADDVIYATLNEEWASRP